MGKRTALSDHPPPRQDPFGPGECRGARRAGRAMSPTMTAPSTEPISYRVARTETTVFTTEYLS